MASASHAGRIQRHAFRSDLQEKLTAPLQQAAQDLQAYFQTWFLETMELLEENVRAQIDPLRYPGSPDPTVPDENKKSDLAFLKNIEPFRG